MLSTTLVTCKKTWKPSHLFCKNSSFWGVLGRHHPFKRDILRIFRTEGNFTILSLQSSMFFVHPFFSATVNVVMMRYLTLLSWQSWEAGKTTPPSLYANEQSQNNQSRDFYTLESRTSKGDAEKESYSSNRANYEFWDAMHTSWQKQ